MFNYHINIYWQLVSLFRGHVSNRSSADEIAFKINDA